ncbi:hypothetical protein [Endozoicomonas ascidiicola]|nr:hypothetical protein [Endozoicomonas ascidiicola]
MTIACSNRLSLSNGRMGLQIALQAQVDDQRKNPVLLRGFFVLGKNALS